MFGNNKPGSKQSGSKSRSKSRTHKRNGDMDVVRVTKVAAPSEMATAAMICPAAAAAATAPVIQSTESTTEVKPVVLKRSTEDLIPVKKDKVPSAVPKMSAEVAEENTEFEKVPGAKPAAAKRRASDNGQNALTQMQIRKHKKKLKNEKKKLAENGEPVQDESGEDECKSASFPSAAFLAQSSEDSGSSNTHSEDETEQAKTCALGPPAPATPPPASAESTDQPMPEDPPKK